MQNKQNALKAARCRDGVHSALNSCIRDEWLDYRTRTPEIGFSAGVGAFVCAFVSVCVCVCVSVSYSGYRMIVRTEDRFEKLISRKCWHRHKHLNKSSFSFSHYTALWACPDLLVGATERPLDRKQSGLITGGGGVSASGKQWSRSFELSPGRWQSCRAQETLVFLLGACSRTPVSSALKFGLSESGDLRGCLFVRGRGDRTGDPQWNRREITYFY